MSGIGSVGSTSAAQYLKKLSGSSSCSQTDDDASAQDDLNQDIQAAGGTIDYQDLRSQIEASIKSALSGSTSSSDPSTFLSKVKDAIGQALQANGIDPSKLKGALESQFGQAGGIGGAGGPPPSGGPPPGGPHGAKKEGQDLLSLLDDLDTQDSGTSTLDALLGTSSSNTDGTSTNSSTDLGSILDAADSSSDSSSSEPFGLGSTSSTDDLLSQLYSQLFKNFPNGSGLDTVA